MRVAVAQLGARMHYAVPRIFQEAGLLEQLFTDSYIGNKPWLEQLFRALPRGLRPGAIQRWLGRQEKRLPARKVTSFDLLGLRFAMQKAKARDDLSMSRVWLAESRAFNARIIQDGLAHADAVWGFSTASEELFRWARAQGKRCVLEQVILPSALQAALLEAEAKRWPGWQDVEATIGAARLLAAREAAEWELADLIVAGSGFVVDGLVACGVPAAKCRVVPYGVDQARFARGIRVKEPAARLRVLFAGEVGLRKGAPYLLEALRRLGPDRVEARLAGRVALATEKLAPYGDVATFLGVVPRTEMPGLFAWADVFVLPSIFEGSATVTYEALAAGVPVIATPNCGSIVREGIDGAIVPVGSVDAIAEQLDVLALGRRHWPDAGIDHPVGSVEAYGRALLAALGELR